MKAINNTFDYFLDDLSYPDSCGIRIVNVGFSHNAPNYSCGYVNRKYLTRLHDSCILSRWRFNAVGISPLRTVFRSRMIWKRL